MIGLTVEEINNVLLTHEGAKDGYGSVAKAQLKKVVEWLGKYRSETTRDLAGFTMGREDWQSLLEEVVS